MAKEGKKKRAANIALTKEASDQVHRDIEAFPAWSCKNLIAHRPELYGGKYKKATQNRHSYLLLQKKKNPGLYYTNLSKIGATGAANTRQNEEEFLGSVAGDDDTSSEERELLAPNDQSFRNRPGTRSGAPLKSPPPKEILQSPPPKEINIPAGTPRARRKADLT
ncbi:hypothetical protein SEMRO_442_G143830.1 [Seminavis robusta]|uniref:Uncharacterized protein n=1 Tax=Seminavis robusta TaxID=568900 RepID=A0A9N8DY15_9STRA|nr:hypothetical protein SEMRO_442_G143830.1 [Seminavis robusta]|eukprot:Sro442_g143830.1 n/a (165) ;mRNA; r:11546-12040